MKLKILLTIILISAFATRYYISTLRTLPSYDSKVDSSLLLEGQIVTDVDISETNDRAVLETTEGKILLRAPLYSGINYGDVVKVYGMLSRPENFETDQGKVFDYENYLYKDDIYYILKAEHVEILEKDKGSWIKKKLFAIKHYFLNSLEFNIPSPESGLMAGIIIGDKSWLTNDMRNDFIRTGTIHIIALSGYNVTIVAEGIMKFFGAFARRATSIYFGIVTIILFVIMTGGSSTAIRAGIMAVLALVARATGRTYDLGRALFIAFLIMIFINPKILFFDVSFQLSFIATFGLIYLTPIIFEKLKKITNWGGLREIISATIATNIFVFPFILYKMGTFSLVSLPANILILPFMAITMFFGFVVGLLGGVSAILAIPFSFIAYKLLAFFLFVIKFLSNIPFASFNITHFPLIITVILYGVMLWYIFVKNERR